MDSMKSIHPSHHEKDPFPGIGIYQQDDSPADEQAGFDAVKDVGESNRRLPVLGDDQRN